MINSFWPKDMNPRYLDAEQKAVIMIHEQMRQMTERIKTLEGKIK